MRSKSYQEAELEAIKKAKAVERRQEAVKKRLDIERPKFQLKLEQAWRKHIEEIRKLEEEAKLQMLERQIDILNVQKATDQTEEVIDNKGHDEKFFVDNSMAPEPSFTIKASQQRMLFSIPNRLGW